MSERRESLTKRKVSFFAHASKIIQGGFLPAGSLQFCRLYTMASALAAPPPADGFAGFRSAVVQSLKSTGTLDSLKVTHSPTSHASPAGVPCPRASSLCDDGARNAWMAF